jgi:hypothetical protein
LRRKGSILMANERIHLRVMPPVTRTWRHEARREKHENSGCCRDNGDCPRHNDFSLSAVFDASCFPGSLREA